MDRSNALLPITEDFPPKYIGFGEVGVHLSLDDWEVARAKYAAYQLLVDACMKSVLAFDVQYRAVPPDADVTREWMAQWRDEIDAANHTAIEALQKALMAVEGSG